MQKNNNNLGVHSKLSMNYVVDTIILCECMPLGAVVYCYLVVWDVSGCKRACVEREREREREREELPGGRASS